MGFLHVTAVVFAILTVAMMGKLAGRKGIPSLDLTAVIFVLATLFGYLFTLLFKVPVSAYTPSVFLYAVPAGFGGGLAVLTFNHAIRMGHFGFSNAIYRSSFLVPVVVGILFFGAVLKLTTSAGILLILGAIFLMSWSNDAFSKGKGSEWKWFVIIMAAFLLSGLPRVGQLLTSTYKQSFFAYLFLSYAAGAFLLLPFYLKQKKFDTRALLYGSIASIASYIGVYCTLSALKTLSPAVVYPITLSAPIILGMGISSLFFKEKIRGSGWLGVFAGITGITILALWK